jgi:hypothetical protein
VKLPPRPEHRSNQFEGRTPEEAVRLARREFGHEASLRCWKIRSGGVLGFFAREAFVAGVTPPPGAIKAVKAPRPVKEAAQKEAKKSPALASAQTERSSPAVVNTSLSKLVEETSDRVTLGADQVPAAVFSEVLAEAQAAVGGAEALVVTPALTPAPMRTDVALPGGLDWAEGLHEALGDLGVPVGFRPLEATSGLDGLARALAALPQPDPLPGLGGAVIVVVGGARDARVAAGAIIATLGLAPSDLMVAERTDIGRQRVARRRSANKVTVLVVEATVRSRSLAAAASWIEKVRPDYVVGAVPATTKRSDVESWQAQVGQLHALALSRLAETASPGDLMGLLPIAFLDGAPASTLRWMVTLLGTKLAGPS